MRAHRRGRRWLRVIAGTYIALLVASHVSRIASAPEERQGPARLALREVDSSGRRESTVEVAYREWPADDGRADAPMILLLHGSPGNSRDFLDLAPRLARELRVIAPDLPGFGASDRRVGNYSIRAHADYVAQLLAALEVGPVHVLGFSMGGGVALELSQIARDDVLSVTLLSAIGVQELELLGNYHLNHAVHGLQLAGLWLLQELTPHFGSLDEAMLDVPYARNFYDSDQRPLRGRLESLTVPTLILHGKEDVLVPLAAAREHHRIVPHSEMRLFDDSHFMVFRDSGPLATPILDFVHRVEGRQAPRYGDADAQRVADSKHAFDPATAPPASGIALVLLVALLALATLVSEDLTSIGAGLMVAQGRISFLAAVLACSFGIVVGDMLLYAAGRLLGRPWLDRAPIKWWISAERVERGSRLFARRGPAIILLSRFVPGTRLPTYFAAGLLRTNAWTFLLYFLIAVSIWTPLLVGLALVVGERTLTYFSIFERYALPATALLAVCLWLAVRCVPPLFTFRGRRQVVGAWRRLRWEFWPPWLAYAPLVPWLAWLSLRHRSPTVFTAANPAIPLGGFVGESKSAILERLDRGRVARFVCVADGAKAGEWRARVEGLFEETGRRFPVVLKPDVGERGRSVSIVSDWSELEAYSRLATGETMAQQFVVGLEFGVFYVRRPYQEHGSIFSVTQKLLPHVTGDGSSTLEELMLRDRRAVAMARRYRESLRGRLREVPDLGERIRLLDVGTHCRGAVFLDGSRYVTPQLARAIESLSHSFDGFFFGRYDIRAPSLDAFQSGEQLTVLELNGVTSEATHIYDPQISLVEAYRVLFRQWSLAFEIGAANRADGVRPASPRELIAAATRHYRQDGGAS